MRYVYNRMYSKKVFFLGSENEIFKIEFLPLLSCLHQDSPQLADVIR